MSQSSFEQVLKEVQTLPPEDVERLREVLNAPAATERQNGATRAPAREEARTHDAVREMARAASLRDFTADRQWLKEHCDEYAGQWVALKNGQLISHGKDHLAVYRAAKAAGHPDALMELVEPSDARPFIEAEFAGMGTQDDESSFRRSADQWLRETEHVSSIKQACMHPAYQRIIGMGPAVVPYLLRELEQAPDHWFWALHAITGADPAQAEDSVEGARMTWLKWGREKGYL